jgi:transposase
MVSTLYGSVNQSVKLIRTGQRVATARARDPRRQALAYCKPANKVALGFVEGLNNKIRVIQRRAYGLHDEEYLKLKIPAMSLSAL